MLSCPKCAGETKVVDGRASPYGFRRRRVCESCNERFSTLEIPHEDAMNIRSMVEWLTSEIAQLLPPPKGE